MAWTWIRRRDPSEGDFVVVGGKKALLRDAYDFLMRAPTWVGVLLVAAAFLLVNLLFGVGYTVTGGVAGVRARSLSDAFFFSVQTLGTLGYGVMYPETPAAHALVTCEVLIGVFALALATGFTFAKFSSVRARLQFAERAVIAPWNGVPTLMLRVGNERRSRVIDAEIRVMLTRLEVTREGVRFYRMLDLALERERIPNLARSWTVFHRIVETSPLHRATPESLAAVEAELAILVRGLDETSSQTLHAQTRYDHTHIVWGARHADLLSELPDGRLRIDLAHFHTLVPTEPTECFPYPAAAVGKRP